jgi:hypothetical protein
MAGFGTMLPVLLAVAVRQPDLSNSKSKQGQQVWTDELGQCTLGPELMYKWLTSACGASIPLKAAPLAACARTFPGYVVTLVHSHPERQPAATSDESK